VRYKCRREHQVTTERSGTRHPSARCQRQRAPSCRNPTVGVPHMLAHRTDVSAATTPHHRPPNLTRKLADHAHSEL
jgi:hypothetical protein